MGFDEGQVVIDVGELLAGDFVGHEVGKHFLGPHIIKPAHRHQVAEPHVSRFVSNQVEARHFLVGRRLRTQKDAPVIELDATWMLHATELVARQHDKAIVLKRVWDTRVLLHPPQRQCHLIEHDGQLCHLGSIGLTIEACQQSAVTNFMFYLELSCREREQVGGNGFAGLVADTHPPLRKVQFQAEHGFQVRLVKTGEDTSGMVRHKQRVEVVITAVQRFVTTMARYRY